MAKKKKTVMELNLEFDFLSERIKKLEEKEVDKHLNETKGKVEGIEEVLKSYDKKIEQLDKLLKEGNKMKSNNDEIRANKIKCNNCGTHFEDKPNLKDHITEVHPSKYKCEQ